MDPAAPDPPHPGHIGLPVSGSRYGHANPRGPAAAAAHCHRSGRGARRARSRRRGLQMAMSVRPCPGCSAVPAGIADAGLREQDRAEMVKYIRLCLDRTDICTATLGVVSPPDGSTTRPSPGRCWRPAWPSARAAATSARGTPGNAHSAARDMSGQLKAHAQDEVDDASCVTTHLRRWALPGPLWCGSAEARRSGQSARCHPALAAQLTCTRNRRSGIRRLDAVSHAE
jgi:hypothetical protein